MTPVPKHLSPRQVLAWRKAVASGARSTVAAAQARGGIIHTPPATPPGPSVTLKVPFTLPGKL